MTTRHVLRLLTLTCLAFAILASGAAWADDEPGSAGWAQAFRFDCDEGEDCPSFFSIGGSGGYLGVELTDLSPELRSHFGVTTNAGVLIGRVMEDSPAERAGLLVGDIITAIGGKPMRSSSTVGRAVRAVDEARALDIDLYRDGELITIRADIEVRERTTFDLGSFMGNWNAEEFSEAMAGINWEELAANSKHISQEAMREALGSLDHVFEEKTFEGFLQGMESFDHEGFAEKMDLLRERMEELEQRLEDRFEENDTP